MAKNALLRKREFSLRKSLHRKIFHNSGLKISIEISIFRRTQRHFPKGHQIKIFSLRQKQCLKYRSQKSLTHFPKIIARGHKRHLRK
jgi:hypothetical protein